MKRMSWLGRWTLATLFIAGLGGCKQDLVLERDDLRGAVLDTTEAQLESQPIDIIEQGPTPIVAAPATVDDPSRTPRPITLKEAISIALVQGNVGGFAAVNPGNISDALPQFNGAGASGTDKISAFAYDPAIAAAEIERSLSKFDARWINSFTWNQVDNPTLTLQQSFSNGDTANLTSTLAKPLPTGGVAGITFSTDYLNLANPSPNPQFVALATSYTPRLRFVFEQPLLQNFGVEINQLLTQHPGSQLIPGLQPSGGQGAAGILVTRIRSEQSQAEFERQVNNMLFNVEAAYWNLYSAYYDLYAREEGLKLALDIFNFFKQRVEIGRNRKQELYQFASQYERFRGDVITSRGQLLERERALRGLLGMTSTDGTRLVPIDEPAKAPYKPDFNAMWQEAYFQVPELTIARQEVKARQLDVMLQRNQRRPDLRFFSSYDIAGLGQRLDGGSDRNAFRSFAANNFNSYQLGLRLDMPLGFRNANALVKQATLNQNRSQVILKDSERKAREILSLQYRQLIQSHRLYRINSAQRALNSEVVELQRKFRGIGDVAQGYEQTIQNDIQVQRDYVNTIAQEYASLASYNIALAGIEYAKGTIKEYNNVNIAEGPLPNYVNKKAIDHFKARDVALKLREHPVGVEPLPLTEYQPISNDGIAPLSLPNDFELGTGVMPGTILPTQPGSGTAPEALPDLETPSTPEPKKTNSIIAPMPRLSSPNNGTSEFAPIGTVSTPKRVFVKPQQSTTVDPLPDITMPIVPPR